MITSIKILLYLDGLLLVGLLFFRWALVPRLRDLIDTRVFLLTLLVPALLLFVPKLEMAYAVLAVAVMLTRNRPELCAGYLLLLPMVPELSLEYSFSGLYIARFSAVAALGIGALLGMLWTPRTEKLSSGKYDFVAAVLVLLFTVLSARGQPATNYLRSFADVFFTVGVPYIIVSRAIGSENDAKIVLSRFYLAGALAAFVAIFEATRHWALYDSFPDHLGVTIGEVAVLNVRAGFMRSGGPFLNPTAFAFFLAVLPAGLWSIRSYFHEFGYRAMTALLLLGLLATQSRGAWIACAAGYCGLWAYRGLRGRAAGAIFGAAALYAIADLILPEKGRLAESLGRAGMAADTMEYRRALLSGGLAQVRDHLLLGQSGTELNTSMIALIQGQGMIDFVNTHLYVTLAGGLVGLAIWIMIWSVPFIATWQSGAPVAKTPVSGLQLVPETMLVVSMVALLFTSTANRGLSWPVVALGLTGPLLALARRRDTTSSVKRSTPLVIDANRPGDFAPAG